MIELRPLHPDQHGQVAEWEFSRRLTGVDWERYKATVSAPKWEHLALYDGDDFIGCVSLERTSSQMVEFHVVTARRKIHPQILAKTLRLIAGVYFKNGFTALTASIPRDKRAAARLALRSGMREWGHTPTFRYFILTRSRYLNHGWQV